MQKKVLFIIVPILLIIIIAATIALLYFTTDIFKSAEQLFWENFASVEKVFDTLENNNQSTQKDFKNSTTYTSEGNIAISQQTGEQNAQSINLITNSIHNANTARTYMEATLKNGDIDLLKASYINSGDIYAIKCDDVLPNYVGIRNTNLNEVAKVFGVSDEDAARIPTSLDIGSLFTLYTLTDTEKQHIIDTYSSTITETIGSDKYQKGGKEQITLDGKSYEANKYTLILTGDELKQVILNCLNQLQNDSATLVAISNRLSVLGMNEDYTDIINLATRIAEMSINVQNMTITNTVTIDTYSYKGVALRDVIDISGVGKLTIDISQTNNSEKVILTMEQYTQEVTSIDIPEMTTEDINNGANTITNTETNNINANVDTVDMTVVGAQTSEETNTITNQGTSEINTTEQSTAKTMQITIQKSTSPNSISNIIEIIPDVTTSNTIINYTATLGNVQNNTIANSYAISISDLTNGSNSVLDLTYDTNITAAEQVNEIIELTNSNTVVVNNYPKEQIAPFLDSWYKKFVQVVNSKIQIVGINTNQNNVNNSQVNNSQGNLENNTTNTTTETNANQNTQ